MVLCAILDVQNMESETLEYIGESTHDKMCLQQCLSLRWKQELYYFGSDREEGGSIAPDFPPLKYRLPVVVGPTQRTTSWFCFRASIRVPA